MSLIQLGNIVLHSGATSYFKLVADAFIYDNLDGLVLLICQMVGPFSSVEGVPQGGLRLAEALRPFTGGDGPHLIVDDVLTTGGSMEIVRGSYLASRPEGTTAVGAVVFARGQCPPWVKPLLQMPECFWLKPRQRGEQ